MKTDRLWLSDQGDGTYVNPVLHCDYSDPDVIRVGDTYYLTASSFNYVPGLPILTSRDLVNWTLSNYALEEIPLPRYRVPQHAQGVWAPSLRYHKGWFYVFFGMPDEGIFCVRARNALGKWEKPVCVLPGKGLIDPCPFWDDDGSAWVVHGYARSRIGFKSALGIFPMSPDGTKAIGEDHILYDGRATQPTIEGPKVYKREGWYYIFAPAGGVEHGWQTVLRSRRLLGPFEERVTLRQGDTPVNGPHQGAWVETQRGESWFLHFQSLGLYGRVLHLQPMRWLEDGWPEMGAGGQPCLRHAKPSLPTSPMRSLQASDDFSRLGLQWQFMGNPPPGAATVAQRPGWLRLRAFPTGETLWQCPQVLSQKLVCPSFSATVRVDGGGLALSQRAGLALLGDGYAFVCLERREDGLWLLSGSGDADQERVTSCQETPVQWLRLTVNQTGLNTALAQFSMSMDGVRFAQVGPVYAPGRHTWVGARTALFCMSLSQENEGYADFADFRVEAL